MQDMRRFVLLAIIGVVLGAHTTSGQEVWSLTTADFKTQTVSLNGVDAKELKITAVTGGVEKVLPLDQFVELSRTLPSVPRTGKYDLFLVGGERLNGDPVSVKGETVIWKNPLAGEMQVPMTVLLGLAKAGGRISLEKRRDDVVTLGNGDVVRGTIMDLNAETVMLKTDAGDTPVPLASVTSATFAGAVASTGKEKPSFRILLSEGSTIAASSVKLNEGKLEAATAGGAKLLDLSSVSQIEQINGPVAWLSSRNPSSNVFTPYLGSDQRFVARMNVDFEGNPIRFRDRTYARSIATHAYSKLTFPLDGSYPIFRTRYAMDPKAAQGAGGDVTVRIKLDDKIVHEQANVRPGILSNPVVLDLGDAKVLTLEVDYGQMIDSNDRLNWLEPALLKQKPSAEDAAK